MANAQSVVDFLTSRGIRPTRGETLPLFGLRKRLFESSGLSPEKGDEFRGTESENLSLLNRLQTAERSSGVSASAENVFDLVRSAQPVTSLAQSLGFKTFAGAENLEEPLAPSRIDVKPPSRIDVKPGEESPLGAKFIQEDQSTGVKTFEMPRPTATRPVEEAPTISPEQLEALFGGAQGDITAQALEQVLGGATFPLRQEEAQATKEAIRIAGQAKKESTIAEFARRGLFFSGKREASARALDADTLAKELGVDRKFALLIATGLENATKQIVKDAQKGSQQALASMRALGFDINPLTGQVQPTLAARKAVSAEARSERQLEAAQKIVTNIGGRKVIINKETGDVLQDLGPSTAQKPISRVFTDSSGNVTEILSDPFTGLELARIPRGAIGRVGSADPLDNFIDGIISESLGDLGLGAEE